ncbi:MAG: alpha-amylase family glycosyl hydrolase [Salinivirgaceae bacterium]
MKQPLYPTLYQINTRVWLTELSSVLGRSATLDDIPDSELDHLASLGFDWIWFLSVWTTGEMGRSISRIVPEWRHDYEKTLPDLREEDIGGSGFAIADYRVHPDMGGDEALKRLRTRLQKRGLKLMLDFVPNHIGPDHPWVEEHPEFFITGTEKDLEQNPQNFIRVKRKKGDLIFAFGRDPYFSGWPDTVQLDYSNPATVEAMTKELIRISSQCNGVRCDMAMLVLPNVFERTWGRKAQSFWPEAIKAVHKKTPDFCFMAEVYWDMEWDLQQLGFDYTYDKRLYDRLHLGHSKEVREHFYADLTYQNKLARFLENHDEPRAALTFKPNKHEAAAIITYLSPGLRFFHQGQFEGRLKRISPHLVRAPKEELVEELQLFYSDLLSLLKNPVFRNGSWRLLPCEQAWDGNGTWDSYLAFSWEGTDGKRILVVVNYANYQGQCYVKFPFSDLLGTTISLKDLMGEAYYNRHGNELISGGLFLDMPAWGYHVFEVG